MSSVTILEGLGGLQKVRLELNSITSAEVYLWGATLTSWVKHGQERIFVSTNAIFNGVKAIRGGIPVVFPQFGQPDTRMAQHGFARTSYWDMESFDQSDSVVSAVFVLHASPSTKSLWPHNFSLRYCIHLTNDDLTCAFHVANPTDNDTSFMCQTLLHTYLAIRDVTQLTVSGFQGRNFSDKLNNGEVSVDERELAIISREVDRVYIGHENGDANEVVMQFPGAGVTSSRDIIRVIASASIHNSGATTDTPVPCDIVFWNPWTEKARSLADLGEESFPQFVCVEPGTVGQPVEVSVGSTLILTQIMS